MHLTREALDAWAAGANGFVGVVTLRLEEGDSMIRTLPGHMPPYDQSGLILTGPAIVELVVYRDGGWSARELVYETPESIALAASLAQRPCGYGHTEEDHEEAGACVRPPLRVTEDGASLAQRWPERPPQPERYTFPAIPTPHTIEEVRGAGGLYELRYDGYRDSRQVDTYDGDPEDCVQEDRPAHMHRPGVLHYYGTQDDLRIPPSPADDFMLNVDSTTGQVTLGRDVVVEDVDGGLKLTSPHVEGETWLTPTMTVSGPEIGTIYPERVVRKMLREETQ